MTGKKNLSRVIRGQRTSEILFFPRECVHKIHIFKLTCNFLFIIWAIKKKLIYLAEIEKKASTNTGFTNKKGRKKRQEL